MCEVECVTLTLPASVIDHVKASQTLTKILLRQLIFGPPSTIGRPKLASNDASFTFLSLPLSRLQVARGERAKKRLFNWWPPGRYPIAFV